MIQILGYCSFLISLGRGKGRIKRIKKNVANVFYRISVFVNVNFDDILGSSFDGMAWGRVREHIGFLIYLQSSYKP